MSAMGDYRRRRCVACRLPCFEYAVGVIEHDNPDQACPRTFWAAYKPPVARNAGEFMSRRAIIKKAPTWQPVAVKRVPCCGKAKAEPVVEPNDPRPKYEWGPALWATIHTRPFVADMAHEPDWFQHTLLGLIPCKECREHAEHYLNEHPIPEQRDAYFAWTVTFHNEVNIHADEPKPVWTLEQAKERWMGRPDGATRS